MRNLDLILENLALSGLPVPQGDNTILLRHLLMLTVDQGFCQIDLYPVCQVSCLLACLDQAMLPRHVLLLVYLVWQPVCTIAGYFPAVPHFPRSQIVA